MSKYLVTSALPYANGPIHFGHIAGVYLPADIYTRHQKRAGKKVIHISGSDEHGVAIMQNAQKVKKPYQEYVNEWHKTHAELFKKYDIQFDFFGQTSKEYHKVETLKWFDKLYAEKAIEKRAEKQLQCQSCSNFLPDRFVEGECYVCHYKEARGDECPSCGTWIDPLKLLHPQCKFCGSKEVTAVDSFQWYLVLSKYFEPFKKWFAEKKEWRKTVIPFVESLSKDSLHDRAITRDLDWGIDVPLPEAKGKKLYVWFDAPIGYVSNTKAYLESIHSKEDYLKDWWQNKETKIINFIGKDNIIFHSIIFPVMSMGTGFVNPVTDLPANQYVNLEGKQFSKSKGWYIDADEAVAQFGSEALRFYLTSLIPETADTSFTWKGFELKINSELANNIGNFVNRAMKFFYKNWPDGIDAEKFQVFFDSHHGKEMEVFIKDFHEKLENFEIRGGLEHLMSLGNKVNLFISERAPWSEFKVDKEKAAETIALSSVYVFILGTFFAPYLPKLSDEILSYFGESRESDLALKVYRGDLKALQAFFNHTFKLKKEPQGLVPKIDSKMIEELEAKLKAITV